MITDCHVHIQPFELVLSPPALELMKKNQRDFDRVLEFTRSPKAFLKHMDQAGLDRAVQGMKELELLYRAAESNGIPVMFQPARQFFPAHATSMGTRFTSTM